MRVGAVGILYQESLLVHRSSPRNPYLFSASRHWYAHGSGLVLSPFYTLQVSSRSIRERLDTGGGEWRQ